MDITCVNGEINEIPNIRDTILSLCCPRIFLSMFIEHIIYSAALAVIIGMTFSRYA
jgi:hypothetical protein